MKIVTYLFSLAAVIAIAGCSTPKRVAEMEGRGTKHVYAAEFDSVWRAAMDAAQMGDLDVITADKASGYIAARRSVRVHTFGENVGLWVRRLSPTQTEVEVVSRQAGPPVMWLKNWENEIQRTIASNLTRDIPAIGAAPGSTIIDRGSGNSTIVIPENRRETIIVPNSDRETVIVPGRSTSQSLRDQQRRVDTLSLERDRQERALADEVDEIRRDILQRQLNRINSDLREEQDRLRDLERDFGR